MASSLSVLHRHQHNPVSEPPPLSYRPVCRSAWQPVMSVVPPLVPEHLADVDVGHLGVLGLELPPTVLAPDQEGGGRALRGPLMIHSSRNGVSVMTRSNARRVRGRSCADRMVVRGDLPPLSSGAVPRPCCPSSCSRQTRRGGVVKSAIKHGGQVMEQRGERGLCQPLVLHTSSAS